MQAAYQTKNLPRLSRATAAAELLKRRNARKTVLAFTTYTMPEFEVNWHHEVVCQYLDKFIARQVKNLIITFPPRHGKSELVSRRLPAYILGIKPDARIMSTSYSADLASMNNRDVQRIIDSPRYQHLFPDSTLFGSHVRTVAENTYLRNADIFEIVGHKGTYRSAGIGGGITGLGFDYGIIDDPIKNRKEANSQTVRDSIWGWYLSTFRTRREPGAGMLIIMTRWHVDDLVGRVLAMSAASESDPWTVINFPAIATKERMVDDPRQEGEALWEARYSREELRITEFVSGVYEWSSMYQQSPTVESGTVFKREWLSDLVQTLPPMVRTVRYWDLAMSGKTAADYTVGVKMGIDNDNHFYILDVARKQLDWNDVVPFMKQTIISDGRQVLQGIEKKGYMSRAIKDLHGDLHLAPYIISGEDVDADKYTRALPVAAKAAAGFLHLTPSHWTGTYLDELCAFTPDGGQPKDDQVDATSGAYAMLTNNETIGISQRRYA